MAASPDEPKVVTPFMPSLLHYAAAKIAISLYQEFGIDALEDAYSTMQLSNSTPPDEKSRRPMESLLHIPAHLRRTVMQAVRGSHHALWEWSQWHYAFREEHPNLHWRSDGSINATKTARDLVWNAEFHIKKRFYLACTYFLDESVKDLWSEMERDGTARHLTEELFENVEEESVVGFWVGWLRERPRGSWRQSLATWSQRLDRHSGFPSWLAPRCSTFFPVLQREERRPFLDLLSVNACGDLRLPLYALPREEERQVLGLRGVAYGVLRLHLEWPLQTLFLETAGKLWEYLDDESYRLLLFRVFHLIYNFKDFDYSGLFEQFWGSSPLRLREIAREGPYLRERIDSFFEEKRRKRKLADDGQSREI